MSLFVRLNDITVSVVPFFCALEIVFYVNSSYFVCVVCVCVSIGLDIVA